MGKRIQRLKEIFSNEKQPMTNGNKYDTYTKMEVQEQIDLKTANLLKNTRNTIQDVYTITTALREQGEKLVQERQIQPYFLLQYQANYFCGTCKFECEDTHLKRMIINVIRGAFFMGCAGIYYNEQSGELEPVYINQMDYGVDGKLRSCKTLPLKVCMSKMNEYQRDISMELKGFRELNEKECERLAVFSWGTMGYSCWYSIWPFVQFQHQLLTQIIINSFIFNKKFIYKMNNMSSVKKEIELWFDTYNPFIVNLGNSEDITNRFSTEDVSKGGNVSDLLDFYNKTIAVYYQIMGRQINLDVKKERNVSNEVDASQENFDVLQSDWLNQFELFISDLNRIAGVNVNVIEKEQEEVNDDEPNNNQDKDNSGEQ